MAAMSAASVAAQDPPSSPPPAHDAAQQQQQHAPAQPEAGFELPELGDFALFMSPFYSPSGHHNHHGHQPHHQRTSGRRRSGVPFTPISNSWDDGGFGDLASHPMFADQDDLLPKASEFGADMSALDKLTPELVAQNSAASGVGAVVLDTPRPLDEFTAVPLSPTSTAGKRKRAAEF